MTLWVATVSPARAQQVLVGEGIDRLGTCLGVADLDGDGKAEIVAGAPNYSDGIRHGQGRVVIVRSGKGTLAERAVAWLGDPASSGFGQALALGDWSGDGKVDLLVGAPLVGKAAGAVYFFRGGKGGNVLDGGDLQRAGASLVLKGSHPGTRFGASIACGDLDADGRADVVVAEPAATVGTTPMAGRVFVFRGRRDWSDGILGEGKMVPDLVLIGEEHDGLGTSLLVEDVNGDGIKDLVALTPFTLHAGRPNGGSATILLGAKGLLKKPREVFVSRDDVDLRVKGLGALGSCAATMDVDGDGQRDLLLGAPNQSVGSAAEAGVLYGLPWPKATTRSVDLARTSGAASLFGSLAGEGLGGAVCVFERDNSGAFDLLVGCPRVGRVVLFESPKGLREGLRPSRALMPSGADGRSFGTSLGAGDLNGEGKIQYVIGAPAVSKVFVF